MPEFKTAKEATDILDWVSGARRKEVETGEYMPAAASEFMAETDLDDVAIDAWEYSKSLPEGDEIRKQIRGKVFDSLASNLPPRTRTFAESLDDLGERMKIMNTIDENPELIARYKRKQGYETEIREGEVLFKKPGDPQFQSVDPEGFDMFDWADLGDELVEFFAEAAATGAKVAGAFGGGIPGFLAASAGGAAALTGVELAKQEAAKKLGTRETTAIDQIRERGLADAIKTPEVAEVGQQAVSGALGPGIGKVLGFVPKATGRLFRRASEMRSDVDEIISAAKEIGAEPTPAMLRENMDLRLREDALRQLPEGIGNIKIKERSEKLFEAVDNAKEVILAERGQLLPKEAGEEVLAALKKDMDALLAPAENTFQRLSNIYDETGARPDTSDIVQYLDEVLRDDVTTLRIRPDSEALLKKIDGVLGRGNIKMNRFNDLRSEVGKLIGELKSDPKEGQTRAVLGDLYRRMTESRTRELAKLEDIEPEIFKGIKDSLNRASNAYRAASESASIVTSGKRYKEGSPAGIINAFINGKDAQEKAVKTLAPTGMYKRLETLKKDFPGTFELVRQSRIKEIYEKALDPQDVSLNTKKLIKEIDKLTDREKALLFGEDNIVKHEAIKKLVGRLPENVGPSGTPRGNEFMSTIMNGANLITLGTAGLANRTVRRATYEFLLTDMARRAGFALGALERKGLSGAIGAGIAGGLQTPIPDDQPLMRPIPMLGGR